MAVTLEQARLMQQQIGIQYVRKMPLEKIAFTNNK